MDNFEENECISKLWKVPMSIISSGKDLQCSKCKVKENNIGMF